jgi:hypothetical protein
MYSEGHFLLSLLATAALVGISSEREPKLAPWPTAFCFAIANFVDFDHVTADPDTDNGVDGLSLTMYPGHIYSSVPVMLGIVIYVWLGDSWWGHVCLTLALGILVHLAGDILAHMVSYNKFALGIMDGLMVIACWILLWMMKPMRNTLWKRTAAIAVALYVLYQVLFNIYVLVPLIGDGVVSIPVGYLIGVGTSHPLQLLLLYGLYWGHAYLYPHHFAKLMGIDKDDINVAGCCGAHASDSASDGGNNSGNDSGDDEGSALVTHVDDGWRV